MNTTPRNLPVGGLYGAWQTNTWLAMLGVQSGLRISASASATVAVGPRITISGVMSPPAVASSYESRRVTTSASSSSIAARIARALVRRHLAEQVGEVVVLHLVEHADEAVEVEVFDEPELLGLGKLLEHVGESLVVHRLGELAALRQRAGRARRRRRRRGACRAGGRPRRPSSSVPRTAPAPRRDRRGDSSGAGGSCCAWRGGSWRSPTSWTRPSVTARRATSLTVSSPTCLSISSAPISTSPGSWLERVEVDVPAPQPHAVAVELGDTRRVDEDPAALARCDEAEDPRRGAGATWHDDDVLDLADRRATGVEQGQAHHPERVDQLACHAGRLALDPTH